MRSTGEAPATTRVASALYNEVPLKRTRPGPASSYHLSTPLWGLGVKTADTTLISHSG